MNARERGYRNLVNLAATELEDALMQQDLNPTVKVGTEAVTVVLSAYEAKLLSNILNVESEAG